MQWKDTLSSRAQRSNLLTGRTEVDRDCFGASQRLAGTDFSDLAGRDEAEDRAADRGAAGDAAGHRVGCAVQYLLIRDMDPFGVDKGLVAIGDETIFDGTTIGDRAAGNAAARLLQRFKPAMQSRVGIFRR